MAGVIELMALTLRDHGGWGGRWGGNPTLQALRPFRLWSERRARSQAAPERDSLVRHGGSEAPLAARTARNQSLLLPLENQPCPHAGFIRKTHIPLLTHKTMGSNCAF